MDVVLLGSSLPGVENHAVGALRAALRATNVSESFIPFRGFVKLERTIEDVLSNRPRVVGISLQTIESAIATLAFTKMLRRRHYAGRVVLGGHFATLNAHAPHGLCARAGQVARSRCLFDVARRVRRKHGRRTRHGVRRV